MKRRAPSAGSCGASLALVAGLLASACPEHTSAPAGDAKAPCKEVGQRCEFAPGKLGSCVVVDNCRGPTCFICQSQH
jgi:hypothetical protein